MDHLSGVVETRVESWQKAGAVLRLPPRRAGYGSTRQNDGGLTALSVSRKEPAATLSAEKQNAPRPAMPEAGPETETPEPGGSGGDRYLPGVSIRVFAAMSRGAPQKMRNACGDRDSGVILPAVSAVEGSPPSFWPTKNPSS